MNEGRLQCTSCGQEVQEGANFCSSCGAAVSPHSPSSRSASDPYLLLMTANVLRLRRQWSLAEAKCSELLKLDPENAAAHSLMGDVLRDQGRVPDAIEWYKLAVDRDPANETDRRKLEALIDRRFAERGESCAVRYVRRLLRPWRKLPPEGGRAPRPVCPWAMVTAGVFAVTLLFAFGMMLLGNRVSTSSGAPGTADMAHYARPQAPASTGNTSELSGDICALEQAVLELARDKAARSDVACQVSRAEVDPRQGTVEIEISMPAYWAPEETRKGIMHMASVLAPMAARAEPHFTAVKVRCLTRHAAGAVQLAMVAEGNAEDFRRANTAPEVSLEKTFRSIWWSAALKPETSPGPGTPHQATVVPTTEGP